MQHPLANHLMQQPPTVTSLLSSQKKKNNPKGPSSSSSSTTPSSSSAATTTTTTTAKYQPNYSNSYQGGNSNSSSNININKNTLSPTASINMSRSFRATNQKELSPLLIDVRPRIEHIPKEEEADDSDNDQGMAQFQSQRENQRRSYSEADMYIDPSRWQQTNSQRRMTITNPDFHRQDSGGFYKTLFLKWRVVFVWALVALVLLSRTYSNTKTETSSSSTTSTTTTSKSHHGWFGGIFGSSSSSNGNGGRNTRTKTQTGPYRLIEIQQGKSFFDHYDFFDGPDSVGSAGYQIYVGKEKAEELNLAYVATEGGPSREEEFIYLQSASGGRITPKRQSVRLHGKRRFNRGLFILDVAHMPTGCGVWPAFWLTDEENWPDNGEIDIVEPINTQSLAMTAMHTSAGCTMYGHVDPNNRTGVWNTATGVYDRFTGEPDFNTTVPSDNCWVAAPHQWGNQGCVAVSAEEGTIGEPMNNVGGGIYVLDWDPANGYIKSWVFKKGHIPLNLQETIATASQKAQRQQVVPDPSTWGLPYALFAIGDDSGCTSDHFKNMRLIFNLAFCGAVAGNKFVADCPKLFDKFNVHYDSVRTCNAYLATEPEALKEAYWKVRGVYVYEREWETVRKTTH